jgi:hypothetical protein
MNRTGLVPAPRVQKRVASAPTEVSGTTIAPILGGIDALDEEIKVMVDNTTSITSMMTDSIRNNKRSTAQLSNLLRLELILVLLPNTCPSRLRATSRSRTVLMKLAGNLRSLTKKYP